MSGADVMFTRLRTRLPDLPESGGLNTSERNRNVYQDVLDGMTFRELAPKYGVTFQRIYQIVVKVEAKIKKEAVR